MIKKHSNAVEPLIPVCSEIKIPVDSSPKRYELSEKEAAALRKSALAYMKKHEFQTVEEMIADHDSNRGY